MELEVAKIADFQREHKRMPSFSELQTLLGYKSKSAVHYFVQKLIDKGYVAKDDTGRLLPKNLGEVKVLGVVEAGFGSSAEQELLDTMSLDEWLVEKHEASYLLKVKGESMIDAGILPGDYVLVERGAVPREGEIVIAEVDGSYTMKRFRREERSKKPYLEASNKEYRPIHPRERLTIAAVVRAVIRKYK